MVRSEVEGERRWIKREGKEGEERGKEIMVGWKVGKRRKDEHGSCYKIEKGVNWNSGLGGRGLSWNQFFAHHLYQMTSSK